MKKSYSFLLSSIFLLSISSPSFSKVELIQEAQVKQNKLTSYIREHRVKSVEIIWINPTTEFRQTVSPMDIEKLFDRKLIIRRLWGDALEKSLLAAIKSTTFFKPDDKFEIDIRWGVKFFDEKSDVPIASIFVDGSGELGMIDGTPVAMRGDFYQWLDRNFSKTFKMGN
ncbi:hypothetical protein QN395_21125 [Undibacterium sp. RTI2.2]|uniref:hypothetical protein n=1 Tax=unclassified Undibacterium TaxID=2630295 RepID=UPI002AB5A842|nr:MULTISPECIES: hypothetical protein [unclassified Undibacterium]MDY7540782.1 hypothetical protein [Undibacterium sp. 5I1]MEB0118983.1 hypothetical protein [Undibacterium sp. RTI2.2]MEB0259884.1 hypothetical protein [Undibacterium sp. 5I1]